MHRRDAGLDPRVLAVRALARAADADPARDVPGLDARARGHRDRRAHAVPPVRRLVAGVRVAARLDVADAGAAGGACRGGADERGECQRADEDCEEGPRPHASVVGGRSAATHPSFLRSGPVACGVLAVHCLQCGAMATTEDRGAAESLDAWRANVYERAPERTDELFSTISGIENEPLSTPGERRRRLRARPRLPRRVSVHARRVSVDVPRPAVDDAPVRRLRHRRRRRTSASATSPSTGRPGSRPPSTCRRSWATTPTTPRSLGEVGREGRRGRLARRHGDALRAASRSATSRPR